MTSEATSGQVPDIYGQVHPVEFDKLAEFDSAVKELTNKEDESNKCLLQAIQKSPELLTDAFKLMFLRCEVLNTDLAVDRYANYWDKRVEIFGPDKAFQPLTLDKALSEDIVTLELGVIQLVTGVTDPWGRAIVYIDPSVQDRTKYTRLSLCRALWYTLHAALEIESAQKHGVVFLDNPSKTKFSQFDRKLPKLLVPILQGCIPLRLSAIHLCHPPPFVAMALPIVKFFVADRMKNRIFIHTGSTEKVLKSLNDNFGLDRSVIPAALGGDAQIDHVGWLQRRSSKTL